MAKIIELLIQSIRSAARYNSEAQVAPACILWPDYNRQWEAVIPRLQEEMPELVIHGNYRPEKRTGPAIWLRCLLARKIEDVLLPAGRPAIIYLPGLSRQDVRMLDSSPDDIKPLAELQYRGAFWSQINANDWTVFMFLKSDQGGLGLDAAKDTDTKNAMQLALYRLLDENIEQLKGKRLDKDFFNTLLTGDSQRNLLQWLNQEDAFRESRGENEWKAFVEVCKSQFAFHPEEEGILAGAAKLAAHAAGPWKSVWERFCEAPRLYPNIPMQIRKCRPPADTIYWHSSGDCSLEGWPQWNEEQEGKLRQDLVLLGSLPSHVARKKIEELEKQHATRRALIWAKIGEAPLAQALEHLSNLARLTGNSLAAGTIDDLMAGYAASGWRADDALMRALAYVKKQDDFEAAKIATRNTYLPWAEESARHLQKAVSESGYPGGNSSTQKAPSYTEGECLLFVDGLRFDAAKRLSELLADIGYRIEERISWAPLPTVTPTGKPAVSPVRDKIRGLDADLNSNTDFEPSVAASGQSLRGGYHLKRLLKEAGWAVLDSSSSGTGKGNSWCEFGNTNIDSEGHNRGWKLAFHLEGILGEIQEKVVQLLAAGWKNVRIVTDHGWLLLPGGLPKTDLPSVLTENKWGRCAALKPGSATEERLYPWYWNPDRHFALADGISCFREGTEYDHGGLSLQECLTIELNVRAGDVPEKTAAVEITDVVWKGLRCTVALDGEFRDFHGLMLDIRTQPGNPTSSKVVVTKPIKDNGTVSVVVEDEELEGTGATIVLLDLKGKLVAMQDTVIGRNGQ
jgi:hypothetical protein